jgi:hypothetical protein
MITKIAIFDSIGRYGVFQSTQHHPSNMKGHKNQWRGLLPSVSERIAGQQFVINGKVRTWDGRRLLCEHNNRISICAECGGGHLCVHKVPKSKCKECGGSKWCDHDNDRTYCLECLDLGIGGGGLCQHRRPRTTCKKCKELGIGGGGLCEDHGIIRSHCRECGGGSYCEHDKPKSTCRECGGGSYCKHDRRRSTCKDCWELDIGGGSLCNHGIRRVECPECGGSQICQHGKRMNRCPDCDGSQRCIHNKLNFQCEICEPESSLAHKVRVRIRGAIRRQGGIKDSYTLEMLGCSSRELMSYIEALFSDGMNWENVNEWHIDHIRPCASFDLRNYEEQVMCFHFTNLQPMWAKENLSKHAKYDSENFNREWTGKKWIPKE